MVCLFLINGDLITEIQNIYFCRRTGSGPYKSTTNFAIFWCGPPAALGLWGSFPHRWLRYNNELAVCPSVHTHLRCLCLFLDSCLLQLVWLLCHCRLSHFTGSKPALFNTLRTGDADLHLYITTVQDGWRNPRFNPYPANVEYKVSS
jgi:hypothetical protein